MVSIFDEEMLVVKRDPAEKSLVNDFDYDKYKYKKRKYREEEESSYESWEDGSYRTKSTITILSILKTYPEEMADLLEEWGFSVKDIWEELERRIDLK
jgi:hypothetical protein